MDKRRRDMYLSIIRCALLNIRYLGNLGKAADCSIEADHVHNIPELLATEVPGKEKYYWEVERKIYLKRLEGREPDYRASFQPLWEAMERLDEMPDAYTIYIPLVTGEALLGTTGIKRDSQTYEVLPRENYDPAKEEWEFPPGSIVECEIEPNSFPEMLVAKRRIG